MIRKLALLSLVAGLSACGGGEHEDVKLWMAEVSKDLKGGVPPLPELKPFPVIAYEAAGEADPYSAARLEPERASGGGKYAPDFDRPREQLESFPLESMRFIGVVTKNKSGGRHALIQVEGVVYQVGKGNYMGLNFGRIVDITDNEVVLKEIVQDPSGQTADWVERPTTLQLLEGTQGIGSGK